MSEHATPEEKTEMPTDRRMDHLREDGQVHLSTEIAVVASLFSGFIALLATWEWLLTEFKLFLIKAFSMIAMASQPMSREDLYQGAMSVIFTFAPPVALVTIFVAFIASLSIMLQTKWNVKKKWVKVKFEYLNPIQGVKKVFSPQGAVTTLKAIAKLILILPIGFFSLKAFAPEMVMLIHLTVEDVLSYTGAACASIFWKILYILITLAIIDWFWTKFQWLKQNRMTKEEVKDERKMVEGDEKTRRKILSKGMERIAQRIRDSVPQADVVVTNPTHYAIALKYDRETMSAPQVVAKGRGFLAQRIREIARASGVPVLERKTLARALYKSAEVGTEIPHELFKAAAEVLAYVYKLKNPYKYQAQQKSVSEARP
ncbi:MAG: EscU/YscU/HrcU family type III secretion system export apparatus switch protein [Bdellovibrionota bacterium]